MLTLERAKARLSAHGQEHVLRFFDELEPSAKEALLRQIETLDLKWLDRVFKETLEAVEPSQVKPYADVIRPGDPRQADALKRGEAALSAGAVAVLLVAGGSGTRLGFDGPKGDFPVGPISERTLFQMHVDRLLAIGARYGQIPPLYLMTGPSNHQQTVEIFAAAKNYGYPEDRLLIFVQGVAPAVDEAGKLLMGEKHEIVTNANGNGGLFAAMADGGAIAHMRKNKVQTVCYIQVDNALAQSCDPIFVGHHLRGDSQYSCKAIPKTGPFEKVGNYALVDGRLGIVEYTEIPEELATAKNDQGELAFGYGNPGLFMWSADFVKAQAEREDLPYHRAHKKIPHIGAAGERVVPETANGFKLESFALDTLLVAERTCLVAGDRDAEFAPVKNAEGVDSPASARGLMNQLYRQWVKSAGGKVADGVTVEINPRFALDEKELADKISADAAFDEDTYLSD